MSPQQIEDLARAADRPFRRSELAGHVFAFAVASALLLALYGIGEGAGLWPVWLLAGWSVALAADAWRTLSPRAARTLPPAAQTPAAAGQGAF